MHLDMFMKSSPTTNWFSRCLILQLAGDIQCAVLCRFDGVTAYQTDWSIAAVTLHAQGSPLQPEGNQPFNLPMASLEGQPGAAHVWTSHTQHSTIQHTATVLSIRAASLWSHAVYACFQGVHTLQHILSAFIKYCYIFDDCQHLHLQQKFSLPASTSSLSLLWSVQCDVNAFVSTSVLL